MKLVSVFALSMGVSVALLAVSRNARGQPSVDCPRVQQELRQIDATLRAWRDRMALVARDHAERAAASTDPQYLRELNTWYYAQEAQARQAVGSITQVRTERAAWFNANGCHRIVLCDKNDDPWCDLILRN